MRNGVWWVERRVIMAVKVKTELHPVIEGLPIIFKDGEPMAVVVDIKQLQFLLDRLEELEDRELFSDPEIIAGLQAGQDDYLAGRMTSLEDVVRELGLENEL
jgi:hypothetical protein